MQPWFLFFAVIEAEGQPGFLFFAVIEGQLIQKFHIQSNGVIIWGWNLVPSQKGNCTKPR